MSAAGWTPAAHWSPLAILDAWLGLTPSSASPPVQLEFHDGSVARIVFVQSVAALPDTLLVLRLWPSSYVISRASGAPDSVPIWVGTVTRERVADVSAFPFSGPAPADDFDATGMTVALQFPDARVVTRGDHSLKTWDRRVVLLCAKDSLTCPRP
ncbi:hypothetical protein [Paraburkholderia sp. WC7.3g]|uniref:hypothetical protein n=1 Tax=Paraburkholderia sp. WC7.3g TaxID=2991070 RepID=UPI003D1C8E05